MAIPSDREDSVVEIHDQEDTMQQPQAETNEDTMQQRPQAETNEDTMQQPQASQAEIVKLKNRVRAFTGAFVVMISPALLAIVLKKVNLAGAGKYQGRIRALGALIDLLQRRFAHLAAITLQMGIMPFLCVMVSEACAGKPSLSYVAPRLVAASKLLVFVSTFLLMALGCGILLFHKSALLVLTFCSAMAVGVVAVHIWHLRCCVDNAGEPQQQQAGKNNRQQAELAAAPDSAAEAVYHSKLEHLLELSAGITVMMFLVLEFVALEGLLRNRHGVPVLPPPSPTAEGQETTFLGAALLISFVASALGVSLMNVWTSPHVMSGCVVLTDEFMRGLNLVLQALPISAVVVLLTLDVLPHAWKLAVWLLLFPPAAVLLLLLARHYRAVKKQQELAARQLQELATGGGGGGSSSSSSTSSSGDPKEQQETAARQLQGSETVGGSGSGSGSGSSTSSSGDPKEQQETAARQLQGSETVGGGGGGGGGSSTSSSSSSGDPKPAPLELAKVAFTGFLAVAVPSVSSASVCVPSRFFVLFSAATVLMGLLWRLLTHEAQPSPYVVKAANHASFLAHVSVFFAGIAFWVMAALAVP